MVIMSNSPMSDFLFPRRRSLPGRAVQATLIFPAHTVTPGSHAVEFSGEESTARKVPPAFGFTLTRASAARRVLFRRTADAVIVT
jgi:hypothetical protein